MEELKNLKAQQEAAERNAGAQAPCRPETCERLHTAKYIAERNIKQSAELNQRCVCLSKELAAAVQEREADRRRLMETYRQMRGEPLVSSKMLGDMARYGYRCDEYTVLPDGSRRMHFGFGRDGCHTSQKLRRAEERAECLGRELETQAEETEEMRAELEWLRKERTKLSQNYDALAALEAKERQQLRRIRALLEDPLVVINTDDERKLRPVKNTSRQEVYHTLVKVQSVLGLTRLWTEAAGNGG